MVSAITDQFDSLSLKNHLPAEQPKPKVQEKLGLGRIKVLENVHWDDIHCIIKLSDQSFISGSKDGSIKKWSLDGKLIKIVEALKKIDYTQWITALTPLNDKYWMSGRRNGQISLWDHSGQHLKDLKAFHAQFPDTFINTCKDRNIDRVNCLTSFDNQSKKPFFFAGWATQFTLNSYDRDKTLSHTYTNDNDWVYAVEPITEKALLVITGCQLDLFELNSSRQWKLGVSLIKENKNIKPRPFISAISPLEDFKELYSLSVFDGSVRVIDVQSNKIIYMGQEHKGRVWAVENIQKFCFASCADDGLIKLWDIRQPPQAIFTLMDNETEKARVSVIKRLADNVFLSGSCPDDIKMSVKKAQFSFWDTRRL